MGIFLDRAELLFRQSRYDLAERELRQELSNEPDNANAHAMLGVCLDRLKRPEEALKCCREAVRLAPASAYPHYALAFVLDGRNQLDEASVSGTEAIRLDPTRPHYFGQLSYIRVRQRRYQQALEAADAGLQLDPHSIYCLNRRGMALGNMGRFEDAEQAIRTALSLHPENADTLANLGWILVQRKQALAALEYLRESLRIKPESESDWTRQTTIDALVFLIERKQIRQANEWFTEALERDPQLAEGRQRLLAALRTRIVDAAAVAHLCWTLICFFALFALPQTPWMAAAFWLLLGEFFLAISAGLLSEPVANLVVLTRRLGRRLLSRRQRRDVGISCLGLAAGACLMTLAVLSHQGPGSIAAVCTLSLVMPLVALDRWTDARMRWGLLLVLFLLGVTGGYLTALSVMTRAPGDWIARGATVQLVVGVCGTEAVNFLLKRQRMRKE